MNMPSVEYEHITLKGGLDQITPTLSLKPGVCREAVNFECLEFGGYGRIAGYERYSGQPGPSNSNYVLIPITTFVVTPVIGDIITSSSGGSGVVIHIGTDHIIITKELGAFVLGDTILVGVTTIGVVAASAMRPTEKENATYNYLASNLYRADILPPIGVGPIRGGFMLNNVVYCVRDAVGGLTSNLWGESPAGWIQIAFLHYAAFTSASTTPLIEGEVLKQNQPLIPTDITATLRKVVLTSGSWVAGTAAGNIYFTTPVGAPTAGTFDATNPIVGLTSFSSVNLTAVPIQDTLLGGGKGEVTIANFYGTQTKAYYADGVNRMFEFDGVNIFFINSAAVPDKPKHIASFKNHLMYSLGNSLFNSNIGDPFGHTALGGAAEVACGDTITNLIVQPGSQTNGALSVHARNTTFVLYGSSSKDWNLVVYNKGTGALDYTGQNMAQSYTMDDRGVIALSATLNFGNFDSATLTNSIRPFIAAHRQLVACSTLDRQKSQYRIFFTDGMGLYITVVNGVALGCMPVQFPIYANIAFEGTRDDGSLVKFFGGSDGHVYQLDKGSSFDGGKINARIKLNWNAMKSPRVLKRFRKAAIEVTGPSYAEVDFSYSLGYGSTSISQQDAVTYATTFTSEFWDTPGLLWDTFSWDGKSLAPTECEVIGTAENIEVSIGSNSAEFMEHTVNSVLIHYTMRRGLR